MFRALQQRRLTRLAALVAAVTVVSLAATMVLPAAAHAQGRGPGFMPPGHAKKIAFVFFVDMEDSHWAAPFVGPMHRLSVIRGYPDGKFQPNKPVTQAEALVMVLRALGYEDDLDPKARYRGLPRAAAWAEPYVALADRIGLLDDLPGFNAMKPASRAWVAALLVAAADVDEDAVEEALGLQAFRDMHDVPAEVRVMVRLAAALGWFKGYPGNWFQPNKPVTRAEMAALIARFLDYDRLPAVDGIVRGTITNVQDDRVTLREQSGTRTYRFADEATVVVNDQLADRDDLRAGMRAWAHVITGEIVHISARGTGDTAPRTFETTGDIERIRVGRDRQLRVDGRTYDVDDRVEVRDVNNRRMDFEDLQVGWRVRLTGEIRNDQRVVTAIRVLDEGVTERVDQATLYDIDTVDRELDVVFADGSRNSRLDAAGVPVYDVDSRGRRSRIDLARLSPGDALELAYENDKLVEIRRTGRGSEVIGVITEIRLTSGSRGGLTIDRNLDPDVDDEAGYRFAAVVDVSDTVPGLVVRELRDLDEGYVVRLTLNSDDRIIRVVVTATEIPDEDD